MTEILYSITVVGQLWLSRDSDDERVNSLRLSNLEDIYIIKIIAASIEHVIMIET